MEFRLLGTVQIWSGLEQMAVQRRQERLLLAVLLLEPGKAVSTERLMELLWPDAMPTNPRRALQVYVSRLRTMLDVELTGGLDGYAIQAPPGSTDIEQFRTLVAQARRQDDLEQRSKLLTDALALWRGPALADVTTEDVRERLCAGLEEERWAAEELRVSTELSLSHHQELLPRLADLTAAQPTRETFAAASMLALYRSGRQADALAVYTSLVRRLDEELGLEPGTEVRDLHVAILRQDSSLDLVLGPDVPRELPADVGLLIGRDDVLGELSAVLAGPARPGVPAVVCLYGAAGTGKSAAAVRLGHRLADSFPDGQLFARLQDVNGQSLPSRTILGQLLRSLGVDSSELPESVEERSALLRGRLAGKSVLLVFDDAIDAGQLHPLLPAGGAVIVTSRRRMLGLEDAIHRELLPLSDETSAELLGAVSGLGAIRVAEVVPHCAGLPLALRIVGARLALIREDVAEVVQTLADESRRLDYLVAGDRAVRASLDLTLSTATPAARRLFACLALVGADEFAPWVAAPLLNTDEATAAAVLENLAALGLVQLRRLTPPRYGLHGLVRARAVELLAAVSDPNEVEQRYLETVLHLVTIADEHIDHGMLPLIPLAADGGVDLPTVEAAAATGAPWLDVELPVARAAVELAGRSAPRLAGLVAFRLIGYLAVRDERDSRETILLLGRDAAVRAGAVELEAELDRALFAAVAQAAGSADAERLALLSQRSVASAERSGVPQLVIAALGQAGYLAGMTGDYHESIRLATRILELIEQHPEAEATRAKAYDHRGAALQHLGRIPEAIAMRRASCRHSTPGTRLYAIRLVLLVETLQADADLGAAYQEEIETALAEAREIVESIGDELGSAHVDNMEACALILRGDLASAGHRIRRAAEIFERRPDDWGEAMNAVARARLELAVGNRGEARRALADVLRGAPVTGSTRDDLMHQWRLLGLGSEPVR
ncbi:BTAD domain-containing putative transcriptional regulator [Kribbella sp. NPDC056345]|uniref:AfsR/SARP family transcriptional regulator n=1 Tax=Kribbella sp. NPDC056345 TaxID=3345789 RepID=UPI0035DCC571